MLNIQFIFKNGHAVKCETYPESVSKFLESINEHRTKGKSDSKFFEINDCLEGKMHSVFINLAEVNSIVTQEVYEKKSIKEEKKND